MSPETAKFKTTSDSGRATGSIKDEALTNNDSNYLEQKIEYLNNQIAKNRKSMEAQAIEFERLQSENTKLQEKLQSFNKNSVQTKDDNWRQIAELKRAVQTAESETKELLEINFEMKDKYKELEAELVQKKKELAELVKKYDSGYVERLENEIQQLRDQNEFSEKLEDIDKLKDIIGEKEMQCTNLQKQLLESKIMKVIVISFQGPHLY